MLNLLPSDCLESLSPYFFYFFPAAIYNQSPHLLSCSWCSHIRSPGLILQKMSMAWVQTLQHLLVPAHPGRHLASFSLAGIQKQKLQIQGI